MVAGLPGSGIGGLYYLGLVAIMPLRFLARAVSGRGGDRQGRLVLRSLATVGAILLALGLQAWALRGLVLAFAPAESGAEVVDAVAGASAPGYLKAAAYASAASLALVLLLVHALRLFVRRPAPLGPGSTPASLGQGGGTAASP